jgi:phage shock protein A
MQSILQKLRVISLSNLHTLLDGIKAMNSIGEYEQYCRDLQSAHDQLDDQAAASRGRKKFLEQQIAKNEALAKEADENIDRLLNDDDPSNDHHALPLQVKYDAAQKLIAANKQELEGVAQMVAKFDDAAQRIKSTLNEAQGKLEALRATDQATKATEKAAKALDGINLGAAPDTAGVEARMAERSAVAENALNRSLERVSSSVGGVTEAQASAEAALAARRARIAEQKKAAA